MSAAAAGVTESLFGRYFLYLMKKLSFRQTYSKQSLRLPRCWRSRCCGVLPGGREVCGGERRAAGESDSGCPGVCGHCGSEGWLSTAPAPVRGTGNRPGNGVQPFPRTRRGLKLITKEGDELLARSEILSCWASAFAMGASSTTFSLFARSQRWHAGTPLPDSPLSEESEG